MADVADKVVKLLHDLEKQRPSPILGTPVRPYDSSVEADLSRRPV